MRVYRFQEQHDLDVVPFVLQLRIPFVVQCAAAFTLSTCVYILYGMMYGNLEYYMLSHSCKDIDDHVLLCQMRGIAGALHKLHMGIVTNDIGSGQPANPFKPFALDITPEKIMVLSEQVFGLHLWVESFQILRQGKPRKAVLTPAYRAPEPLQLDDAASVVAANIWSLGCTYLEILVWYFDGYWSLEEFRENRGQTSTKSGDRSAKAFCYFSVPGNDAKARLRDPVDGMFQSLVLRTEGPMRSAVQIVKQMLQIDPNSRPSAAEVESALEAAIKESPISSSAMGVSELDARA